MKLLLSLSIFNLFKPLYQNELIKTIKNHRLYFKLCKGHRQLTIVIVSEDKNMNLNICLNLKSSAEVFLLSMFLIGEIFSMAF